jgi:protein arginine N-methyltransferase 1
LDYYEIVSADIRAEISLQATRTGMAHGIAVWFDSELIDDVGFSNAPGGSELIYGNAFFPFSRPVLVAEGDRMNLTLSADFVGDDYVWRWETEFFDAREFETPAASFKQSTFFGVPLSPAQLRKRANSYVPTPNDNGAIARFVLSQMDGSNSIEQIARALVEQFPQRFRDFNQALDLAAEISEKYSV